MGEKTKLPTRGEEAKRMILDRLRQEREHRKLTQDQVAKLVGVSSTTIAKNERHEVKSPSFSMLIDWCHALDIVAQFTVVEPARTLREFPILCEACATMYRVDWTHMESPATPRGVRLTCHSCAHTAVVVLKRNGELRLPCATPHMGVK